MVAALPAPNDYDKIETLTDEEEEEARNPKPNARPMWYTFHTQK